MCGICGELSFGPPVDIGTLKRMTSALIHRGPDDEGFFCEGNIGLGHRRLSIIDLSPSGHQPMWSMDQTLCIVFNGEVYNHKEIRPDLESKGYRFRGTSDTEVVLNAIHCWGLEEALTRFIGMFAFAVWDIRTQALCLVRDRVGVKPLFYQKTQTGVLFASELKALYTHPHFKRELTPKGLGQFFCLGYTQGETTVYQHTHKLPAGHYLRIDRQGVSTLKRYWSLDGIERGSFQGSFEDASEALVELCDSAFGYRLVSDVPVGVFLSGGIDSSFLAAFLKKRQGFDLEHITIGFEDALYDEAPKAAQVAKDLGLRHTVKTLDVPDASAALFRFIEIWDEPFGDTSGIPTSILCGLAREQVKVALSADGGDELFCGYESYPAYDAHFRRLQHIPNVMRSGLAAILGHLPYRSGLAALLSLQSKSGWKPQIIARYEKAIDLLRAANPRDLLRVMNEKGWTGESVPRLLNFSSDELSKDSIFEAPSASDSGSLIDRMMRTDFSNFLGEDILTKVDRASMAVSLECRDPFLDHRLAEFAFSLPLDFLYQAGVHKRLLKQIVKPLISPSVLSAPKRGFSIPLYDWMRGPWKSLVYETLSSDRVRAIGILNEKEVEKEVDRFYRYKGGRAEKVMLLLNFQMWAERWHQR
jgi:asparagine synthase (glutamine-hydrolysing)